MTRHLIRGAVLALAVAATPLSAQSVFVVGGPTPDFVSLQAAVNAAANGDVLLVHGDLNGLTRIEFKGVTIVGETEPPPRMGAVQIVLTEAGEPVALRHLDVRSNNGAAVDVQLCVAAVWLEDLVTRGNDGIHLSYGAEGKAGLRVRDSGNVILVDSEVRGGDGKLDAGLLNSPMPGGEGITLSNSTLAVHGSTATGGRGADNWDLEVAGARGGPGLLSTQGGRAFASGSLLAGGLAGEPGNGSDVYGLELVDGSIGRVLDTQILAGPDALSGTPTSVTGGSTYLELPGVHRSLHVPPALRESEVAVLAYRGGPLDLVVLRLGLESQYAFVGGLEGVDHLVSPTIDVVLGFADAAGVLDVPLTVPDLPVGDQALVGYAQPFVRALGGDLRLGAPSHLLVLDETIARP